MGLLRKYGARPFRAVVLHGGPGAPGCAAELCRSLSKHFGVIEHLQRAHTLDGLTAEFNAVMKICAPENTVLVCHSFGAWLALLFAERHPEKATKAVLAGCGPLEAKYLPELIRTRAERRAAGLSDNYCEIPGMSGDMLYFDEAQHKALMAEIAAMLESGELFAGRCGCAARDRISRRYRHASCGGRDKTAFRAGRTLPHDRICKVRP